jgi:hypothetical protein
MMRTLIGLAVLVSGVAGSLPQSATSPTTLLTRRYREGSVSPT